MGAKVKERITNLVTLIASITMTFAFLNIAVEKTEVLGGISLGEYLTDEYRILVTRMAPVDGGPPCWLNGTHLEPLCEGDFEARYSRMRYHVKINSFGIRDEEYLLEKNQNTYRIFALGDSYSFGWGVDNGEAFPEIIEKRLNEEYDTSVEVFNLGILGGSTDTHYDLLNRFWGYSPDIILLQTNPNDLYECKDTRDAVNALRGTDGNYDEFHQLATEHVLSLGLDKACSCFLKYFGFIIDNTLKEGVPLVVYDHSPEGCDLTRIEGDFYRVGQVHLERKHLISRVDAHPNKIGHRLIAESILPTLVQAINDTSPLVLR